MGGRLLRDLFLDEGVWLEERGLGIRRLVERRGWAKVSVCPQGRLPSSETRFLRSNTERLAWICRFSLCSAVTWGHCE